MAVGKEAIEHHVQPVDRRQVNLQHEAVLTGDAMTLDHLQQRSCQLGHLRKLARRGSHADDGADGVAKRDRVEVQTPASNHSSLFQAQHTLAHSRRGHADATRKIRRAHPRVIDEQLQKLDIACIAEEL